MLGRPSAFRLPFLSLFGYPSAFRSGAYLGSAATSIRPLWLADPVGAAGEWATYRALIRV